MKKIVSILVGALLSFCSTAQVLTLNSVLDSIEARNPLLLSYQDKINSDNALVPSAAAWSSPKAGVEFDKNPYTFDNFYNGVVRLSLTQEFPNRKTINAERSYLQSISQIDSNEYCYQRNKVFSEAKKAYYGIYILQKDTHILHQNIALLQSMIELAEKNMSAGRGDIASVYLLQAKLADTQTKLVHDENMIRMNKITVNSLMNADVNRSFSIDTSNVFKNYRALFSPAKDSLEFRRSDIMQMNSMIYSMQLNQQVMALRARPVFGFKFEHFLMIGNNDMFSVMGTMTIPIAPWASRGYRSRVNSMGFAIRSMQVEKYNMVNMTFRMITSLNIEIHSEYVEIDNYSGKVIPAYQKSLDAYLLAYGQNTSDLNMVLMAYDNLQMAQMSYVRHLETLLNLQVDYEKETQIR